MIADANAARQAAEEHHAEDFVTALEKVEVDVQEVLDHEEEGA